MFNEESQKNFHKNLYEKMIKNNDVQKGQYFLDGIVDFEEWEKVKRKVLFVLKEPPGIDAWDIAKGFQDLSKEEWTGKEKNFYEKMPGMITYIFNSKTSSIEYDGEIRKNYLPLFASINLKKSAGGSTTDMRKLDEFAQKYKEDLRFQIKEINPDIIFCAGRNSLYDILKKSIIEPKENIVLFGDKKSVIRLNKWENSYYVINGYHFAQRNSQYFDDILQACIDCREKHFG